MSYEATICQLTKLSKVQGLDNLLVADIYGYPVLVSPNHKEGELGVFFQVGSQISEEFCKSNNLYRHAELNKDPQAKPGFFEDNRKVRTLKLRKIPSEGFWMPLESLSFTGADLSTLKEGDTFKELNGVPICKRFYSKSAQSLLNKQGKQKKKKKVIKSYDYSLFLKHFETGQLRLNMRRIREGMNCILSLKCHGCVSRETIIETLEYGPLPIETIVKFKLDVRVKAYNTQTQEITYEPISNWYLLEDDGDWLEVELEDGTKLEITTNNPVWLPELDVYRRADELVVGDTLLLDK